MGPIEQWFNCVLFLSGPIFPCLLAVVVCIWAPIGLVHHMFYGDE